MLLFNRQGCGALWLLFVAFFCSVLSQELTVGPPVMPSTPLDCDNGVFNGTACVCFTGWEGLLCDSCSNSRLRLTEASGLIFDGSENYQPSSQCLFYIEANSSVSAIHLRVRSFHTECQWDALNVFNGDSIFHPKIAAYTGDIIELPLEEPFEPTPNVTAAPTMQPVPVQYQDPREITLSGSGNQMLLYFYSDIGAQRPGFEIAYWLDFYGCPDNCSSRGECEHGACVCETGWTGTFCHIETCPNNCSGNGLCGSDACDCSVGYTGPDCSINTSDPHWERVDIAPLPSNLSLSSIARASHSVITWGDHMIVYGGYQFPVEDYYFRPESQNMNETASNVEQVTVLRYHFSTRSWDEVLTYPRVDEDTSVNNESLPSVPQPRYGHTAVVYNDTMYVYGGALLPSEEITNEFWALDLNNFTWTLITNPMPSDNDTGYQTVTTLRPSTDNDEILLENEVDLESLPLPVRTHTSHVVGSKMVTLFGLSSSRSTFLSYVQEYDFETGIWSLPLMRGVQVRGIMGHTSVLDPETGRIYMHGGAFIFNGGKRLSDTLCVLDTASYTWSCPNISGPFRFLHSSMLLGPLLVTFGGCETVTNENECFEDDTHAYNILCNMWEELMLPGLPGNGSRYGHSSVVDPSDGSLLVFGGFLGTFHHDLLRLNFGNCSQFTSEEDCLHVNGSGLCAWSGAGECVSVSTASLSGDFTYQCDVDPCVVAVDCASCAQLPHECLWSNGTYCHLSPNATIQCSSSVPEGCSYFTQCADCVNHGCSWGTFNNTGNLQCAPTGSDFFTESESTCPSTDSCFTATSCSSCISSRCMWCPSLNHCVPSGYYPLTYIYAQCLGWVNTLNMCPLDCEEHKTCGECEHDARCGWCNDPSDTGLGRCLDGGFTGPRGNETCDEMDGQGHSEMWHFEQCPACQCNGHSFCVNESICEQCDNNTTGNQCQTCVLGYYGDARNGGNCTECDCNGYNDVCDTGDGSCVCNSFFVAGDQCDRCQADHRGDANNFCYASLTTGFIYRFTVSEDREVEGFFVVTPTEDKSLHFRIDVTENSLMVEPLVLQIFLGKRTENFWILANLTNPMRINQGGNFDANYATFSSNANSSFASLFTFANPSITNTSNYTDLLVDNSENEYTSQIWNGDVSLVIYVYNLTNPSEFRITVDQQDLLFLLYFFATFTICFSVLLLVFLGGWYIKRKVEYRHFVRQQYIELQRRVARPFARLKAVIAPVSPPTPESPAPAQHPSYVAVETCQSGKAAVLSLFVRLPGDHKTGRPCPGRSGLAIGSTLVSVNPSSKKPKDKTKKKGRNGSTSEDEQQQQGGRRSGRSRNRIRLREVNSNSLATNT